MPILNLNGITRKPARQISGNIFRANLAARQHPTLRVTGKTYNSPFTTSSANLFPKGQTVSTQPHVAALKVEAPGKVVRLHKFVKIHPNEKGSTFSTTLPKRPIAHPVGGPSKRADTPANPNAPKLRQQPRPVRRAPLLKPEVATNLSFLRSGGTIGGHVDPAAGTSSGVSRWATVKKGAVV